MRILKLLARAATSVAALLDLRNRSDNLSVAPRLAVRPPATVCVFSSGLEEDVFKYIQTWTENRLKRRVKILQFQFPDGKYGPVVQTLVTTLPAAIVLVSGPDECDELCQLKNSLVLLPELGDTLLLEYFYGQPRPESNDSQLFVDNHMMVEMCASRETVSRPS